MEKKILKINPKIVKEGFNKSLVGKVLKRVESTRFKRELPPKFLLN